MLASQMTKQDGMDEAGCEESRREAAKEAASRRADKVIDPAHFGHFLCPKEADPVDIPDRFESVEQWVTVLSSNILAEYWALLHSFETPRGYKHWGVGECTVRSATEVVLTPGCSAEGNELVHQLFRFSDDTEAVFRVVTRLSRTALPQQQREAAPLDSATVLHFHPPLSSRPARGKVARKKALFFAYIGNYMLEYSAVQRLRKAAREAAESSEGSIPGVHQRSLPVFKAVLDPTAVRGSGAWHRGAGKDAEENATVPGFPPPPDFSPHGAVKLNACQRKAVTGLESPLEVVQGPPGTGKSMTICGLITEQLPRSQRVLVTCTRNGAVDSLAAKLGGRVPLVVVGGDGTVGPVSAQWRPMDQLSRHPEYQACLRMRNGFIGFINDSQRLLAKYHSCVKPTPGRHALLRHLLARKSKRWALLLTLTRYAESRHLDCVASFGNLRKAMLKQLWDGARVLLCTVAATVRLFQEYAQSHDDAELSVDTVVIDECGCTSEASVAVLLGLRPQQLLLVGDHRQLPAFSLIPSGDTNHAQSLMERVVRNAPQECRMLTEQYRMHPALCHLVSGLFYQGKVVTATLRSSQEAPEGAPLLWKESQAKDERPAEGSSSYVNRGDIDLVQASVRALTGSVAVLTFYKAQCQQLAEVFAGNSNVEVLTVDSVQGKEYDSVVLSCVRSNDQRDIGFLRDMQRLCVAISRARRVIHIVGNSNTLRAHPAWRQVIDYFLAKTDRSAIKISPCVTDKRHAVSREAGVMPEHLVPGGRGQQRRQIEDPEEEVNCFVYFDPVAAQRGVLLPAAWHQTNDLRQQAQMSGWDGQAPQVGAGGVVVTQPPHAWAAPPQQQPRPRQQPQQPAPVQQHPQQRHQHGGHHHVHHHQLRQHAPPFPQPFHPHQQHVQPQHHHHPHQHHPHHFHHHLHHHQHHHHQPHYFQQHPPDRSQGFALPTAVPLTQVDAAQLPLAAPCGSPSEWAPAYNYFRQGPGPAQGDIPLQQHELGRPQGMQQRTRQH
eukprot:TRINITY_DN10004_c0_g4_i1.p1 TRINITY_DN10004_c0_g4~~TRINITY_DN10004_c0_g4_i1.p1  ORF type:complete len:1118 (+),score=324.98 TRINITY_DN10004_c0_g4_i1:352-3354(+)